MATCYGSQYTFSTNKNPPDFLIMQNEPNVENPVILNELDWIGTGKGCPMIPEKEEKGWGGCWGYRWWGSVNIQVWCASHWYPYMFMALGACAAKKNGILTINMHDIYCTDKNWGKKFSLICCADKISEHLCRKKSPHLEIVGSVLTWLSQVLAYNVAVNSLSFGST